MVLAKTLYTQNEAPYLVKGTTLTEYYITAIRKYMFAGLYITDDLSQDIEVIDVISEGLRKEAVNCVRKLFTINEKVPKDLLMAKKRELRDQIESIIDELLTNRNLMVNMIDLKFFDEYTYAHSVNVTVLSLVIGISMGLDRKALGDLGLGAVLHDIGKVFVPKEIVNKPGDLTDAEFKEIKTHPFKGYIYGKEIYKIPSASYKGILDHHEKWDGTGYPNRSAGNDISIFGRIISIADVFDALTSTRSYRPAMSPSEATEYIIGNSGIMFDPDIVEVFRKKVAPYPIGSTVNLSNGYVALVIENYEDFCLRPKVRLVCDQNGQTTEPVELDLHTDNMALLKVVITGLSNNHY